MLARVSARGRNYKRRLSPSDFVFASLSAEGPQHPLHRARKPSAAQQAGLRYERRVLEYLEERYGSAFLPSPWIRYRTTDGLYSRFAQPDGVLFDLAAGRITIVEIKIRHVSTAYFQLRHLYEPLIQFLFPNSLWRYACCEIVRTYDGRVQYPESVQICYDLAQVEMGRFALIQWS